MQIFAEKGFSATSTNEIAGKAGVAEGTIFRHYKTKKDLLITIIEPVIQNLLAPFIVQDLDKVLDQEYTNFEDFLRAVEQNRKQFRSEEHTSELQSRFDLVCRLLLEKKNTS